jgi:hypothetical protein
MILKKAQRGATLVHRKYTKKNHPYKVKRKNTLLRIAAYWKLEECPKLPPIEITT